MIMMMIKMTNVEDKCEEEERGIALKKGDHLDHDGNDHNDDGNDVVDENLSFWAFVPHLSNQKLALFKTML